eukprot:TRINITY_DN1638_c0_g2_i1.p1 TRINITY_DN1638_c0_g2~~TRINITY_DN1638_c0_g2_i1.p1  ORF type:complete len:216 (-),score=59.06 TRINITY_DN1638_c0_g2_i1:337-939(-)
MSRIAIFATVALVAAVAFAAIPREMLNIPQDLARYKAQAPLAFSWQNCGDSSSTFSITSLSISPDPIKLGANITVQGGFKNAAELNSTSWNQIKVTLQKKVFGAWVDIPCEDNVGSCTYSDPCAMIASYSNTLCPALKPYNVPCQCPFPATQFSAGPLSFFVKNPGINWLTNGDLRLTVAMTRTDGSNLGCFQVAVSISS